MHIKDKLELLLRGFYFPDEVKEEDFDYQGIFKGEGARKAEFVISKLHSEFERPNEELSNYIFVSIGGADGSEVEEVLNRTAIQKAILVEYDDKAANAARARAVNLQKNNKTLQVIQGDITQKLDELVSELKREKKNNHIHGLVLSAQAVLHELPDRSPNYRHNTLFGKLLNVFDNCFYFSREPIAPQGWPEKVEMKIEGVSSDRLSIFSGLVNDKLNITKEPIIPLEPYAEGFVNLCSTLAVETLHKLLRSDNDKQLAYELQEQLTSIQPSHIQTILDKYLGHLSTTVEPTSTDGFVKAVKSAKVFVRNEQNAPLQLPQTHARFIAERVKKNSRE
ncbi:hypothetical protein [Photobacterium kasasachensis]|uniref:hypothetical protein n=1 Tax=Photobacterium kasasachensis TaxID=2910240 RepID=UPI003D12518D